MSGQRSAALVHSRVGPIQDRPGWRGQTPFEVLHWGTTLTAVSSFKSLTSLPRQSDCERNKHGN
jgi:hypothetical protein